MIKEKPIKKQAKQPARAKNTVRIPMTGPSVISTERVNKNGVTSAKDTSFFGPILRPITDPRPFSKIEYLLGLITMGVMGILYLTHRNILADAGWNIYTVAMFIFATTGLVFTQLSYNQPPFPLDWKNGFRPLIDPTGNFGDGLNSGIRAGFILVASVMTQIFSKTVLSFSSEEQKIYFVFAAVAEELFFRVMILSLILKFKADWVSKLIANIFQTVLFVAIHRNYYNNPEMLLSVALGGFILGLFFIWWRDPTANVLGHFLLNLRAVGAI